MPTEITPEVAHIRKWAQLRIANEPLASLLCPQPHAKVIALCDAYEQLLSRQAPPDLQGTAKLAREIIDQAHDKYGQLPNDTLRQLAAGYLALLAGGTKSAERIAKLEREVERLKALCPRDGDVLLRRHMVEDAQPGEYLQDDGELYLCKSFVACWRDAAFTRHDIGGASYDQ